MMAVLTSVYLTVIVYQVYLIRFCQPSIPSPPLPPSDTEFECLDPRGVLSLGCSSAQEKVISRVGGFLGVLVAEPVEELLEGPLVPGRDLHADQHAAEVGAVVAVVE